MPLEIYQSCEEYRLSGTEGTYASQSQVEEELLSFCKYYTMAVEKKNKKNSRIPYNHHCTP